MLAASLQCDTQRALPAGVLERQRQESLRETIRLTEMIFADRRKTGRIDPEVEMLVRDGMHREFSPEPLRIEFLRHASSRTE